MQRSHGFLSLVAVGVLALGACSSDSSDSSGSSGNSGNSGSSDSGVSQAAIDFGVDYVGGTAGPADDSLAPITIGFVNQTSGTPAFPENDAAADATVAFINDHLGGIGGHPVALDKCVIQTEEDGQKCAAQFLANDVDVVNLGIAVVGNATFYTGIAGKIPVIAATPATAADLGTPDVYVFNGGGTALVKAQIQSAEEAGAKTIALLGPDNPAGQFYVEQVIQPILDADGVDYKAAYVSDTAGTQDVTSVLPAAGAADADAIIYTSSGPGQCVSVFKGLQALNIKTPVYTSYVCTGDPFPESTGGGAEAWTFFSYGTNVRGAGDDIDIYNSVMDSGDATDLANVGSASLTYADLLVTTKLANQVGVDALSGETLAEAIKSFGGPVPLVPGEFKCGYDSTLVSVCGDSVAGSQFKDGTWTETPSIKTASIG